MVNTAAWLKNGNYEHDVVPWHYMFFHTTYDFLETCAIGNHDRQYENSCRSPSKAVMSQPQMEACTLQHFYLLLLGTVTAS